MTTTRPAHAAGRHVLWRVACVAAVILAMTACELHYDTHEPAAYCGGWVDRWWDYDEACGWQFDRMLDSSTIYDDLPEDCPLTAYFECMTIHSACIQHHATLDMLACVSVCDP